MGSEMCIRDRRQRSRSHSLSASPSASSSNLVGLNSGNGSTDISPKPSGVVSSKEIDRDIQEAIRLHEEGDLERSTELFGRLADPYGANNPLSQVLYGLALRLVHGAFKYASGTRRGASAFTRSPEKGKELELLNAMEP